jgi:transmembrane sensor
LRFSGRVGNLAKRPVSRLTYPGREESVPSQDGNRKCKGTEPVGCLTGMSSETPGAGSAEPQVDWDAVARYLAGGSPASERDSVQKWLASRPADSKLIAALDDALDGLTLGADATKGIDVEAALAKVKARRAQDAVTDKGRTRMSYPIRTAQHWPALAAAAVLVIAIGTLVWRGRTPPDEALTIAARELTTPVGGRDSLVLPDGSQVILGPGSHLTIAAGYGLAARELLLRGEAYFDVKHDASHPFVVNVNGATIRDVGTSFGVHADSTGGVRVAVVSGTVELTRAISSPSSTAVLNAGDIGTVSVTGAVVAQRGAGTDEDLAWRRGTLIFRDATMAEVRDDLRRWYGIELAVRDSSVLRRHMTATFTLRDSVGGVLNAIALLLPATIERRGDTAIVRITPETSRRK